MKPQRTEINNKEPIYNIITKISGWTPRQNRIIDIDILNELQLDQYVYQDFFKGKQSVSLYIGYYFNLKKVGAAHSPLVCFPGQGWSVSEIKGHSLNTSCGVINYSTMIVERGQIKELVFYWFQSFDKTSAGTFAQKLYTLWAKMNHSKEDNAFLRVSIPFQGDSDQAAFNTGVDFIEKFYPVFYKYIIE